MLPALIETLSTVANREAAAQTLLTTLLDAVEARLPQFLAEHDLEGGKALRAMLHLRPELGYRGLVSAARSSGPEDVLQSTTAWSLVRRTRSAVCVDVEVGQYTDIEGAVLKLEVPSEDFGSETFRRLKARSSTHFLAMPVRLPEDEFLGMVTVEIGCPDAAGTPFSFWAERAGDLQVLVDVAALFLERLRPAVPTSPRAIGDPLPAVSARMAGVLETLRAFATSEATLMLLGESGTGKTTLAHWCHTLSPRRNGPFVVAGLYQVPTDQAQALLFGVVQGAYTGSRERAGYVEEAEGGTLFIDEVGDLSPAMQLSLLRLLDARRYQRMGETRERVANIRVIAATNVDLGRAAREGRFRSDLRYRLESLPVEIPPLRERLDEIGAWAALFLDEVHQRGGHPGTAELAPEAESALRTLPLEGNLRAVRVLVERAHAFARIAATEDGRVRILAADVRRAAGIQSSSGPGPMELLQAAAEAYLARGGSLEAVKDVFPGMVLWVALQQEGDAKRVARRLGFEYRIRGGNHLDTLRRYGAKLQQLAESCGAPPDRWRLGL
ncbi:MAG: sigma 54-interacting transcriptional regulator [Myxococcota bacterium]